MIEGVALTFIQEIVTTPRADIVRLIISEGPRFPAIADFYYREVISRGLAGMRALIELAIARGEIRQRELANFPQILVAPAMQVKRGTIYGFLGPNGSAACRRSLRRLEAAAGVRGLQAAQSAVAPAR
jgi:AefR-like transcriptional repressor, C-terminal domain